MSCTEAKACRAALTQASKRWKGRDKSSDGICGDAAHQARKSDHNSGNAWDLTHDPKHGVDCAVISKAIIKDKRTRYVIHNRRIWSRVLPWWRKYTGSNPHTGHMHVSIVTKYRDDVSAWKGIGDELKVGDAVVTKTTLCWRDGHLKMAYRDKSGKQVKARKDGHVKVLSINDAGTVAKIEWGGVDEPVIVRAADLRNA